MEGYRGRVFMPGQVWDRINVFSTAWYVVYSWQIKIINAGISEKFE